MACTASNSLLRYFMVSDYAIKSIVVIDFIDVADIAIAVPFLGRVETTLTPIRSVAYRKLHWSANREMRISLQFWKGILRNAIDFPGQQFFAAAPIAMPVDDLQRSPHLGDGAPP
jgi:hypothetical protein